MCLHALLSCSIIRIRLLELQRGLAILVPPLLMTLGSTLVSLRLKLAGQRRKLQVRTNAFELRRLDACQRASPFCDSTPVHLCCLICSCCQVILSVAQSMLAHLMASASVKLSRRQALHPKFYLFPPNFDSFPPRFDSIGRL